MGNLSDKLSSLTFVPKAQSPARAGFLQVQTNSTTPEGWAAISSTIETTIVGADVLYPDLWANSSDFQSGSDLIFPPYGGISTDWVEFTPDFVNAGTYNYSGNSPSEQTRFYWRRNHSSLEIVSEGTAWARDDNNGNATDVILNFPIAGITSRGNKYHRVGGTEGTTGNINFNMGFYLEDGGSVIDFVTTTANNMQWQEIGWQAGEVQGPNLDIKIQITEWLTEEYYPIVKLYDDASNISMSIKDATASLTGAVRLSSDFAATTAQYGFLKAPNGTLRLHTGNGHGAVNNMIRIFTSVPVNDGDAFTYATTNDDGNSITCNRDMLISVAYQERSTNAQPFGISINSAALTTSITDFGPGNPGRVCFANTVDVSGGVNMCNKTFLVSSGDILRCHTGGSANLSNANDKVEANFQEVINLS